MKAVEPPLRTRPKARFRAPGAGWSVGLLVPLLLAFLERPLPGNDCNQNGVDDLVEITAGEAADCNSNSVPDECDLRPSRQDFGLIKEIDAAGAFQAGLAPLDGDEDLDLFVLWLVPSHVAVHLNDGRGDFGEPVVSMLPAGQQSAVAADWDGDGTVDLALAGPSTFKVTPILNQGDGTFKARPGVPVGSDPVTVGAGDFDGNGAPDLATVNRVGVQGVRNISILLNRGGATFEPPRNHAAGMDPRSLFPADLDGDGDLDLLLSHGGQSGQLTLFKNSGAGTFPDQGLVDLGFESMPQSLAASDLNGDGLVDLAATHTGRKITLLFNDGAGLLRDSSTLEVGFELKEVVIADLSGDGQADVIAGGRFSPMLWIFIQQHGVYQLTLGAGVAQRPLSLSAGDLDGDQDPDLALLDGERVRLLANSPLAPSMDVDQNGVPDECEARAFRRGDANGSGRLDVTDAVVMLLGLFGGAPLLCGKAADADDNGRLNITDVVAVLSHLFLGAADLPEPFRACGTDSTPDGLTCAGFPLCEGG